MANDGTIEFDSSINTDNLNRDLSEMEEAISDAATASEKKAEAAFENMEKQAKRLAKAYEDAGMDASEAMRKAWEDVQANADAFGTNATENFRNVGAAAEDAGTSVENLSGKLENALAAAGLAYGAKEITEVGTSYEKAMNQVAISTGAAGQELENLQGIASNVYADNFGESMEDAAASVAEVYKRTGLVGEELQKATEDAYTLQNAFGYEVNDSLQAATQLMSTFGISAEEAYTLIAQGAQKGLDQNGDMLDTLNEYSVQFANLGYSAEDMFNMLANGVQNGTWSVDKLGDAVKEMNIRLNDGTADEALQALGLGFSDSATNAAALKQAALDVSKADVELQKAQQNVNDTLAKNGSASTEYQEALNRAEQAQINLEKAQAAYNKTSSETTYNLDEIKGKLAAGGSDAQEAIQEIMTALSQVENEQDRYVLGQTLMGTQWEDIGESAVQALMNTQGEISTTSDAMNQLSDFSDWDEQFEKLKRQVEMDVIVPITQKYMPKIEKAIDYVSEHLDEIVEHAKPIAAAIAAAFAVKKLNDFATTAVSTVKTVKTVFMALNSSNPLGWIAIGVSAFAGLIAYTGTLKTKLEKVYDEHAKISDEVQEAIDKTKEYGEEWENVKQESANNGINIENEHERISDLKNSLLSLLNADGTIKTGYEEKVSNILQELSTYSGEAWTVSDNVVMANGEIVGSYEEVSAAIDEVIEKQYAQNYLELLEEEAKQAASMRSELLANTEKIKEDIDSTNQELENAKAKMAALEKENSTYTISYADGTTETFHAEFDDWTEDAKREYEEWATVVDACNEKLNGDDGLLKQYKESVSDLRENTNVSDLYKEALAAFQNGDYETVIENAQNINQAMLTAADSTKEELATQLDSAQLYYDTLKRMAEENPGSVTKEELQASKDDLDQAIIEYAKSAGDGGKISGESFTEALRNSDVPLGEAVAYLKDFASTKADELTESFDKKDKLHDEGVESGDYWVDGLVSSMTSAENYNRLMNAAQSLADSVPSTTRHLWGINSPSKVAMGISEYWGEGLTIGIKEGIPDVSAVSANMANAAVNAATDVLQNVGVTAEIDAEKAAGAIYSLSHIMRDKVGYMLGLGTADGLQKSTPAVQDASKNSITAAVDAATDVLPNVGITAEIAKALVPQTLGIMSNQGSSAVSAYNPAYQQIQTADMQQQTAPAQNNQGIRDIIIPVSIGDETLETVVVNAITRANASSGGWSV